jgi:hypothetical protein
MKRILVGKPEGKKPLGRTGRRLEDNIKIDFKETKWNGMDWINLAQDRDLLRALVNAVMNFGSIKCREILEYLRNWWPLKKGSSQWNII